MRLFVTIALIIASTQALTYNYANPDTDWPNVISTCNTSVYVAQSPIDITRANVAISSAKLNLNVDYKARSKDKDGVAIKVLNSGGHTLKWKAEYGTVSYNNKKYKMIQFHMHQPSEHTIDGNRYDMETHFVHQNEDESADFLVFGYLFNLGGEENEWLKDIKYNQGSAVNDATVAVGKNVDPWTLMKTLNDQWAYMYDGSFTTPPCTQGVNWFVMREVGYLTRTQWNAFKAALPSVSMVYTSGNGNYRPVQALNNRVITLREVVLDNKTYLTAGQIAGIVVGSVLGFLLILSLGYLTYWCENKKSNETMVNEIAKNSEHDDHKPSYAKVDVKN